MCVLGQWGAECGASGCGYHGAAAADGRRQVCAHHHVAQAFEKQGVPRHLQARTRGQVSRMQCFRVACLLPCTHASSGGGMQNLGFGSLLPCALASHYNTLSLLYITAIHHYPTILKPTSDALAHSCRQIQAFLGGVELKDEPVRIEEEKNPCKRICLLFRGVELKYELVRIEEYEKNPCKRICLLFRGVLLKERTKKKLGKNYSKKT
jgi:hypothetical protein